mgnify:CR=1 FL=1
MSQLNRFQRAKMKKRDHIIMGYVKMGLTYKKVAEVILQRHKIKLTSQRIGIIVKQFEAQEVTRATNRKPADLPVGEPLA